MLRNVHTGVDFLSSAWKKISLRYSRSDRRFCINFKIYSRNVQVAKFILSGRICNQLFKRGSVGVWVELPVLFAYKFFDEQKVFLLVSLKEHDRILL